MPLIANSNNSGNKRPVFKKNIQNVGKATNNDTKNPVEKLDLNINDKKSLSGNHKNPNIDILDIPKAKDNRQLSSRFKISKFREIEELPLLKDASANDREKLFLEKVRQCCVVFDWNDCTSDIRFKDIKKRALLEMGDYISGVTAPFSDQIYKELLCMIGINIFRTLPSSCTPLSPDPEGEDDDHYYEPSWPHLQHVYEVFLRFLESCHFSPIIAKAHIDQTFILYLMDLFDCEDTRERDYLKTILHRIYGKMVTLRNFIRKQINNVFFRLIYETVSFKGIGDLLEILGSIINGFQVPVKDENKEFLRRVLLPMHKVYTYGTYHSQLTHCVTEFVRKDSTLFKDVVLQGIIRFWPKTQSIKEIMFLEELSECMEICNPDEFRPFAKIVFTKIGKCIASQHFQVCERALLFWNDDALQALIVKNIDIILPVTFPELYMAKQHWNKLVHGLVFNALKVMMDINQKLFDECTLRLKEDKIKELERNKIHQDWWNNVNSAAKKHPLYNQIALVDDSRLTTTAIDYMTKPLDIQPSIRELSSEKSNITEVGSADIKKRVRSDSTGKQGSLKTTKVVKN